LGAVSRYDAGNAQLKTNIVLEMKSHGIEFHTA
jgi:hypothetical protein